MVSLGLANLPIKFDTKFTFVLETDVNRLFEKKYSGCCHNCSRCAISLHDRAYVQYKQNRLDENFRQYFEEIIMANKTLRTKMQKAPYQKTYKINSIQSIQIKSIQFTGANRQINYLEISLVYDKSDAHKTIYDSYDLELALSLIKIVQPENASNNYSLSNKIDFDFENDFDKQQCYKQFVAYNCKGCSSASLIDYGYNKIFQELTTEEDYLKDLY